MTQPPPVVPGPEQPDSLAQVIPAAPVRRRRLWPWIAAAGAALLVVAVAATLAVAAFGDDMVKVSGTLTLVDKDAYWSGNCAGTGGYSDIREGAQVIVTDAAGKTVGVGALSKGVPDGSTVCRFTLDVSVPAGLGFYGVELGRRGSVKYAEQDLDTVRLSIGHD